MSVDFRKDVRRLWRKYSGIVEQLFGLEAEACPDIIVSGSCNEEGQCMGCLEENGRACIPEDVISGRFPLEGVVSRLCLMAAISREHVCIEAIEDIGSEFGRQNIEKSARAEWLDRWASVKPRRVQNATTVHDPSKTYSKLYELVGQKAITELVREISYMAKHKERLGVQDYVGFLRRRFQRFSVQLSQTEVSIVNCLLNNGSVTYKRIGENLGLTPEWVSRRISNLLNRSILRKFNRVPFSRMGIRMFYVLLSSAGGVERSLRYLTRCPFLYAYRRVLSSLWDVLAILAVPENIDNLEALRRFADRAENDSLRIRILEIASSGVSYCFDHYDTELGLWNIPWDLLHFQLKRIHRDKLWSAFPRVDTPSLRAGLIIDNLDLRILNEVKRGISSVGKIRSSLQIGQERAAERLKRLRKAGIILTSWEVHNIGLNECIFLTCNDPELSNAIAAWVQRLPKNIVSFDSDGCLLMISQLPKGGAFGLISAVAHFESKAHVEALDVAMYGARGFPYDYWDTNSQSWMCNRRELEDWLSLR
ncbi:MAG: Lrp/AsnC family transcriptional regulator [Candidatus Thorarchaeota archaeon]|nr:MAG: Lrp/AsnC family transcriptional regulator [Candidatus Thorarchaeota archaeon]